MIIKEKELKLQELLKQEQILKKEIEKLKLNTKDKITNVNSGMTIEEKIETFMD